MGLGTNNRQKQTADICKQPLPFSGPRFRPELRRTPHSATPSLHHCHSSTPPSIPPSIPLSRGLILPVRNWLWHLTLNTGELRRCDRRQFTDWDWAQIEQADPLPGPVEMPSNSNYWLYTSADPDTASVQSRESFTLKKEKSGTARRPSLPSHSSNLPFPRSPSFHPHCFEARPR